MPSSARGEPLVGVLEVIDGSSSIPADAWGSEPPLESRTRNLGRFADLGPPDIVYIRKRFSPVVGGSKTYGYYHFVRGIDARSAASVSAYLVDLVNQGLEAQPWVSSGSYEIAGATFRAFNALSKVDVIVDLKLPGGISARAVDEQGNDVELTDDIWAETAVCSALRHIIGTGESPLYPCLRVLRPSFDQFEDWMLTAAAACVPGWSGSGRADRSELLASPANSRIAKALVEYFMGFCRYDKAIEFFSSDAVTTVCADALVLVGTAHRLMDDLENASVCINEALRRDPDSSMAWVGMSKIAKARGQLEEAFEAANRACECEGAGIVAYVTLADISVALSKYQDAFIALNSSNIPQLELDYYLREIMPNRTSRTTPSSGAAKTGDVVNVLAQRLRKEKNAFNSKCDETLNELPGKMMTSMEHQCYEVLVKILNDVGWDKLLAYRGSAFVMETDIDEDGPPLDAVEKEASGGAATTNGGTNEKSTSPEGEASEAKANGVHKANRETNSGDTDDDDPASETNAEDSVPKLDTSTVSETPQLNLESPNPEGLMDVPITPSEQSMKNMASSATRSAGKVVCKPWLDYLVTVMYEDLRAIAVWNAEERAFPAPSSSKDPSSSSSSWKSPTSTGSENADEESTDKSRARRSPEDIAATSKRPAPDWLRRGELALRVGKTEDAKSAFWTCIKLSDKAKTPAIAARISLMDLSASEGDAATTLLCADAVWSFVESAIDKKLVPTMETPRPVQRAMFNLISKLGLRTVREAVAKAEVDRNRIGSVLLDAVSWKVHGYSN